MFRTFFHGANDYVEMTEEMDRGVLVRLGKRRRRRVLTALALVMALLVLLPWAASNPVAFQWLSRVAPPVAHFLRPDGGSQEENGIRLEVAEVTRKEDTLLIHLTMEDLEGDRLGDPISTVWCEYQQGRSSAAGTCVPYYDEQTGLLHLNFICDPEEGMQDFDWDRWVTVTVCDLTTRPGMFEAQDSVPLTLGDELDLSIAEGLTATRMVLAEGEFRVFVRGEGQYRMILTGPNGERVTQTGQTPRSDGTWWFFDLGDRDIAECTLTAWIDTTERIDGTWTIQVSPATGE